MVAQAASATRDLGNMRATFPSRDPSAAKAPCSEKVIEVSEPLAGSASAAAEADPTKKARRLASPGFEVSSFLRGTGDTSTSSVQASRAALRSGLRPSLQPQRVLHRRPAHRVVLEAVFPHHVAVQAVAAVEDDGG